MSNRRRARSTALSAPGPNIFKGRRRGFFGGGAPKSAPGAGAAAPPPGPPFRNGESVYFLSINRNKRSLTLTLQNEGALLIARRLMEKADVLGENFLPGKMEEFGLGYEEARRLNPRLVYCSISGYGQTGPDAGLPGYHLIIPGGGGGARLTGDP